MAKSIKLVQIVTLMSLMFSLIAPVGAHAGGKGTCLGCGTDKDKDEMAPRLVHAPPKINDSVAQSGAAVAAGDLEVSSPSNKNLISKPSPIQADQPQCGQNTREIVPTKFLEPMLMGVMPFLNSTRPDEMCQLTEKTQKNHDYIGKCFDDEKRRRVNKVLQDYHFLPIPEVTEADVAHLRAAGVETSITAPIPAFKIADAVTFVGLYHAVMGRYPEHAPEATVERWQANPDLPFTHTTLAEDQAFVAELNRLTGRRFRIPTTSEIEYAIRGRREGQITTTTFHFGDDAAEVQNWAWNHRNSGFHSHGVREALPGRNLDSSMNSFGLIHAIGNVWQRSREGVIRGGAFDYYERGVGSSYRFVGCDGHRHGDIGLRLAEMICHDKHPASDHGSAAAAPAGTTNFDDVE